MIARWPEAGARDEKLEDRFEVALDVVRAIRKARQDAGIDPGEKVAAALGGRTESVASLVDVIATLANADITLGGGEGPATVVGAIEVRIAMSRDAAAERERLERELADAKAALRRSEELLAGPGFADRAPAAVVEKERSRLAERKERVRLLEEEIARLR